MFFPSHFSLTDHDRHKAEHYEPVQQPLQRQRLNSGDSLSSQSSERSDKGDNSKALFKAYQNRYKEHADKHAEESTTKAPFSSWRRSGHFEDESRTVGSKSLDSEKPRLERHSKGLRSSEDHDKHDVKKIDKKYEGSKKLERPRITKDAASPKQQEADKADELMFNFRQALRRHQVSEERRTSEERDSSKDVQKSTAEMIEKIRAAKAQIKHLKEAQSKPDDLRTISPSGTERKKLLSSSSIEEAADEKQLSKSAPKLARQKLVSDDLKAKYIESKKEEKENEEKVRPSETENLAKKRSQRRHKHKEHIEYRARPENESPKISETEQLKVTQTDREQHRKALAEKFKKESSGFEFGTSFTSKPKSFDSKEKESEKMDHKKDIEKSVPSYEPFLDSSDVKEKEQTDQINLVEKPVYSLVYQEPAPKSSFSVPYGVTYPTKSAIDHVPSYKSSKDTKSDETEKGRDKLERKVSDSERKTSRHMKKYAKAKSLELGLLSQPQEEKVDLHMSHDDTSVVPNLSLDELSRKERIDKYKEERKKQLASIFGGGDSELPSLFLSSRAETDPTQLLRSRSLKVESSLKPDTSQSSLGRSKSMKENSPVPNTKISGLQLAEIGSQSKDAFESHHGSEIIKQTSQVPSHSKGLDKDSKEITHRTMLAEMVLAEDREQALKSSFEKETDSGHESTDSSKRIRRQLPSLEDVLGTTVIEKEKNETKQAEMKHLKNDRKKPVSKLKDNEKRQAPAPVEFSLDYSKVKIPSKATPVEVSQDQIVLENIGIVRPQVAESQSESKFETDKKSFKPGFDNAERRTLETQPISVISEMPQEKQTELTDSEIPKDSVSRMSKHFMHTEKSSRPDIMVFGSDFRKPKTDTDYKAKGVHEIKTIPDPEVAVQQNKPAADVIHSKFPVTVDSIKDEDTNKHLDRRSSSPERVISVSEARKVFSEGSTSDQQVFGTEYVQKNKELSDHIKVSQSVMEKDTDAVFNEFQRELKRQELLGVKSADQRPLTELQQEIKKPHKVPTKGELTDFTGMKPPLSPRSERKRPTDSKFGKVSYRSSESEEVKADIRKERERSKSRELSREKEIQKFVGKVKERSPSLESLPKSEVKLASTIKERSPSVDTIPKTGVTKISYRDLEKSKREIQRKFETDSKDRSENVVFGSDYRHINKTDTDSKERPHKVVFGSDYKKTKSDAEYSAISIQEDKIPHDILKTDQQQLHEAVPSTDVKPTMMKVDKTDTVAKQESNSKKSAFNILERSSKEDKNVDIAKVDSKFSIKAEAVSSASGHIIEVPVSPRQKSPPKVVSSVAKDSVPKLDIKTEVGPILNKETARKTTSTQISLERQTSESAEPKSDEKKSNLEPTELKPVEREKSNIEIKPVSADRTIDQITVKSKTAEKERSKPVQYVHPSPLLTFSAKTETPKAVEISQTKTLHLLEKKADIKTEVKGEKQDKVKESDRDFISRRAKEEEWKKPVDTTSEFHKKTVEKMLLDTSLDDILSRNVDYLSDEGKGSSGSGRGRTNKKSRPQSVHEESRSHGRTKRIFKKKNLQRSKSEDRSHFKVEDTGVVKRSQGTEDIQKSKEKATGAESVSRNNR